MCQKCHSVTLGQGDKKTRLERQKKKTNQQHKRRLGCKRKRSLVSLLSTSSISSNFIDESSTSDENYNPQEPNSYQNDNLIPISSPLITSTFDEKNFNLSSNDEINFLLGTSQSSIAQPSSSDSDDNSSDDEVTTMDMNMCSHLSDHRSLYSSTSATVFQFSHDMVEFGRISHLPDKQRTHLLQLFQKYVPSPNLVPKSGVDLLNKCPYIIINKIVSISVE